MNSFSIALFLHIISALGVSAALSLEWTGLRQIRSARLPEQVPPWLGMIRSTNKVGFPSMLATVITGSYMALTAVGWVPWILVVVGALVLVIVISVILTKPRMTAIGQALAIEKGQVSQPLHDLMNDPLLWISIQTRMAIVLGIIFLKIATPGLGGSLLTIGVAIILGILSALPRFHPVPAREASTD